MGRRAPSILTMFGIAVSAAAVGAIAVTALSAIAKVDEIQFLLGETIWWFFGMTLVSVIALPSVGGLIFAGLQAARITHVLAYVGAGAVGGVIVAIALNALLVVALGGTPSASILVGANHVYGAAAIAGGAAILIAWLSVRPDRDTPPNPPTSAP